MQGLHGVAKEQKRGGVSYLQITSKQPLNKHGPQENCCQSKDQMRPRMRSDPCSCGEEFSRTSVLEKKHIVQLLRDEGLARSI